MYHIVFRTSILSMLRELINPAINILLLQFLYIALEPMLVDSNYFLLLIIKFIVGALLTIIFIQVSGRYNIIKLAKEIKSKYIKQNNENKTWGK